MKKLIKAIYTTLFATIFALGTTACGGGGTGGSGEDSYVGTLYYKDGSVMGVTKQEGATNGVYSVYAQDGGHKIGTIGVDGSVSDLNGNDFGVCEGATISDNGVIGECSLPINNPANPEPTKPTTTDTTTTNTTTTNTITTNTTPNNPDPESTNITISANITVPANIYDHDNVPCRGNVQTNSKKTVSYKWSVISRPSGSSANFSASQSTQSVPNLQTDLAGVYKIKVVVSVEGKTASDTHSFTAKQL